MSGPNRWSQIDALTTAHWWLGNEGTACGLDFHRSIHQANATAPRCQRCLADPRVPASARPKFTVHEPITFRPITTEDQPC